MNEFKPDSVLTSVELENLQLKADLAEARSRIPKGRDPLTWSQYQDLKKKDPVKYWKPETQRAMEADAAVLNEKFMDGDFNSNKFKDPSELRQQRRGKDLYVMGTSELVGSV